MSRPGKLVILVASLVLLGSQFGCATSKGYDRLCQSWLDQDADELIKEWGQPAKVEKEPSGNKVLYYDKSVTGYWYDYNLGVERPVRSECQTWFETTSGGKITSYKWQGSACKAKYP